MVTKHSQLRYSNVQKGQNSQNLVCLLAGVKIAQNWFPGGLNKFDILIFVTRLALWNYLTPRIVAALRLLQLVQREDFRGYSVKYSKFWVITRKFDFLFEIFTLILLLNFAEIPQKSLSVVFQHSRSQVRITVLALS